MIQNSPKNFYPRAQLKNNWYIINGSKYKLCIDPEYGVRIFGLPKIHYCPDDPIELKDFSTVGTYDENHNEITEEYIYFGAYEFTHLVFEIKDFVGIWIGIDRFGIEESDIGSTALIWLSESPNQYLLISKDLLEFTVENPIEGFFNISPDHDETVYYPLFWTNSKYYTYGNELNGHSKRLEYINMDGFELNQIDPYMKGEKITTTNIGVSVN